jgi:hypothetical protein
VSAADFVVGDHRNILAPGELLRGVEISHDALTQRHTHRRFTLTQLGRSTLFMIATQPPGTDEFRLTVTAGTTHPVVLHYRSVPEHDVLQRDIDGLPADVWFADPNGTPGHRRHLAHHFAQEMRLEFSGRPS